MTGVTIANKLLLYDIKDVREGVRMWAVRTIRAARESEKALTRDGWERVSADAESRIYDGRPVIWVHGQSWALRPEIHAERLAQRFEAARQRQAEQRPEQPEIKEAIASTTCPQMVDGKPCGGALNRRGVCPSCVTGRMGYRYRYTCESCGCDIVTKEELR